MIESQNNVLIRLIKYYLSEVDKYLSFLKNEYNVEDIMESRRSKKVPRQGSLHNNIDFNFHGIGCRFDLPNGKVVDFDFGYEGRTDGFSLGWLTNFLEENCLNDFPRYSDMSALKIDFERLEKEGLITKSTLPYDNLFYWVENRKS